MKKSIFFLFMILTTVAFAQIDISTPKTNTSHENEFKIKIAKKNAEYNGAIVGYAQACNFLSSDYEKVEKFLFKNLSTIGLTPNEFEQIKAIYQKSVNTAKENGKRHSKNECAIFGAEFKKIVNAINSDLQIQNIQTQIESNSNK